MRSTKGMAWAIAGAGLLALIFTASVLAKKGGLPPGQAKKNPACWRGFFWSVHST